MKKLLATFGRDRAGNIAITTAFTLPLAIFAMALGIDYGHLTLQQRQLQNAADLAAIAAAGQISEPEKAALNYFVLNDQNFAVQTDKGLLTPKGEIPFDPLMVFQNYDAYAKLTKGRYVPDPSKSVGTRFEAGSAPYDAVRVEMYEKGKVFFAGSFAEAPTLSATGTAAADKLAGFSIGTRLASLNEGIVNALLGQLLGTTISLKAMDYQALADVQINLLKTLDALAIDLNLQAGTYADLLKTDINLGRFIDALGKTNGVSPSVNAIVNTISKSLNKTKITLKLEKLLALGPMSQRLIGQNDGLAVNASLFDLISAAATASQGGSQIAVNLGSNLLGLGSAKLSLAIGEPPVGTPPLAVGAPGTIVRTAQTRIALEVVLDGLSSIAGLKVRIPLYIEVANAEARLAAITCSSTAKNSATVDIEAMPGLVELTLGDVDTSAFANFGKDPRFTKAHLLSSALLDITALASVNATNSNLSKLSFSPSDIAAAKLKSVSTKDTLTTLIGSLLGNLELKIELLNLPLILPKAITASLADTLKLATAPLDTILYNTLLTLGVRIGEADVRVSSASCRNPVLVQ